MAGAPIVSLVPYEGRVRVGLVMQPLGRLVDVSIQPAAACETLRSVGHRTFTNPETVDDAAREALATARARCASWAPSAEASVLAGFGGAAFPLLAAAYEQGATPVRDVPRWAEPIVAARTVREGAAAAFGARATRTVVRALVDAIRPDARAEIDFTNLVLALIARDVLEPDCLARVLRADRVPHPAEHLPDPSTLLAARRTVSGWGPIRTERVLLDAAAAPDGLKVLLDTIRYIQQLRGHGPATLPNRLADLHDVHRTRVASAPRTEPPPEPRRVPARRAPVPAQPQRPRHQLWAPPTDLPSVAAGTPLPSTPVVQALDGCTAGDLTFIVPRTAGDLSRWGRILSNCIGGFGPAVAAGRTTIIGIERANTLVFAIEIGPNGAIHQFAGQANRAPTNTIRRATVRTLLGAGVVTREHPENAQWIADIADGS